jgi:hypothetical protein
MRRHATVERPALRLTVVALLASLHAVPITLHPSPKRLRHLKSHLRFIADFGLMDPLGLRW